VAGRGILIVERGTSLRGLLMTLLQNYALAIETATSDTRAIELLQLFPYDLIVLDLSLPATRRVIDFVRDHAIPTPVIALTPDDCLPEDAEVTGASILEKPFDVEVFRALVEHQLSDSEAAN